MDAAEPPPTAGEAHRARAVEEDLLGSHTGHAAMHPQQYLILLVVHHRCKLSGQPDRVLVLVIVNSHAKLKPIDGLGHRWWRWRWWRS
jgi:hypothetical protein